MASVAVATAVSNPNVATVPPTSLSIVLGTPTTGSPFFHKARTMPSVPSPPIATRASSRFARKESSSSCVRSRSSQEPSGRCTRHLRGLPRFDVPRIVPPRCVMPRTSFGPSGISSASPSRLPNPRLIPAHSQPRCTALSTTARMSAFRPGASPPPVAMRILSRFSTAPALFVRVAVSLAAVVSFGAGLAAYVNGRVPAGENLPLAGALIVLVAAVTRRYGIAHPGNGFSSYVLGAMLFAILDRGWAFAAIVAPFAMLFGDGLLRRLPLRAARGRAAHLTAGSTFVGLMYARLSGAAGAAALSADNAWVIALTTVMLPMIVNGTFYLELALGQTIAWVDAQLTLRWASIVYLVSAALALGWLAVVHATIPTETRGLLAGALAVAP